MSAPVVSVTIGDAEYLRIDSQGANVLVASIEDQINIAAALSRALMVFIGSQAKLSPVTVAVDAVSRLAEVADPAIVSLGMAEISEAVTHLTDQIRADAGRRSSH